MATTSLPPLRADHVGSLLRPPALLAARADHAVGRISGEQLRSAGDGAVRDAVRMQEEVGLQSATDGERRRSSWHMDFVYQLGGVTKAEGSIAVAFRSEAGEIEFTPAGLEVHAEIWLRETIFADAFAFLASTVTTATPKLTAPSPTMVRYRGGRAAIDPAVYPEMDEFWSDLSAAYADEIRALGALGCSYLQFDDTSLAYLNDPAQRPFIASQGGDPGHQHETYIESLNAALTGRPAGMRVTTHMCRGASAPRGRPMAATTSWPRRSSTTSRSTASSSSTTTRARVASSRCDSCRRASRSCSAS